MLNCCCVMKRCEGVISVSINVMNGLFIATHVNGCAAYFSITPILEPALAERTGLLGFDSVDVSQDQFLGCVLFTSEV